MLQPRESYWGGGEAIREGRYDGRGAGNGSGREVMWLRRRKGA